jgi:hypothetical protein
MKPPADHERLLDDVLDESSVFRAASLDALLRQAREHQQARRRKRALLVVALALTTVTAVFWRPWHVNREPIVRGTPSDTHGSVSLVRSVPLPASMLVETAGASAIVIRSVPSAVAQLETPRHAPVLREIGDGELFMLLADRPAALIRPPSGPAELLLFNPADWTGFPVQ